MVQVRQVLSGMSVIAVLVFAALIVTVLARPASRAVSLFESQIGSATELPRCSYRVAAICLIREATDGRPLGDDGDVLFYLDDDVSMGFYRVVPERY
jgi:hypothetical protein